MATNRYLIDNSAINRVLRDQAIATRISGYLEAGLGYTCAILDLEALWSARDPTNYDQIVKYRNGTLLWVETDDAVMQRALEVQRLLARKSMHRAVQLPDLIIAAVAERNGLVVLHYDADFDHVSGVTGQRTDWVAPRGSVA